jgi:peptide/nickel transport system permease protein
VIRYILVCVLRGCLTLVGVSLITFSLARLSGNPLDVLLPENASAADRARVAALWGLDRSLPEQYGVFLSNAVRGDFGTSFRSVGQPAMGMVLARVPATLELAAPALLLSVLVAVPLGVLSATHRHTWIDSLAILIALLGQSLPGFWLAIVLVWVFSVTLHLLPTSGIGGIEHVILPSFVLGLFSVAALVRLIRSSMLEVLDQEYIKLARLKGLTETKVIWKHALKNASIAPITFLGTVLVSLLTGSVIVETIFAWPGIGLLAYDATNARDYPVIQAVAVFGSFLFVLINLSIDVVYGWVDPRIRLSRRNG